jgi:hypothetical protein
MSIKKLLLGAAAAGVGSLALAAISPAVAATIVHVGTPPPADPYFFITSGTPFTPVITADFGATINGKSVSFDDIFEFTIPQNGTGSGSLSTSFSSHRNQLTVSQVLINGVSYALTNGTHGQSLTVGGIPITSGALNTIEVTGVTSSRDVASTYSGTMTFNAVVPEPASWFLMIGGVAMIGAALRRNRVDALTAA